MPTLLSINNYHYRRGGAEAVYFDEQNLMREAGWQVVPFAMQHPMNEDSAWSGYFPEELEYGREYSWRQGLGRALKVIYSFEAKRRIHELLAAARPDIAHAHNIYHHLSPSILDALRRQGVPVVMTLHDLKLACPAYRMLRGGVVCERCKGNRIHEVAINRCIKGSAVLSTLVMVETAVHRMLRIYERGVSQFVVPSRFYRHKLIEWGMAPERLSYVPNYVDATRYPHVSQPGKRFVYFGRLSPEKGLQTLIEAAADTGAEVDIIGSGPEEGALRDLAQRLNVRVGFPGHLAHEDLVSHLREYARAIVLPSRWYENSPIALLEAYALGIPVIGSAIGGIPEMIEEGRTGYLVQPGDAHELAGAMGRLAALPEAAWARMGDAARRKVERDFSRETHREALLDVYRGLLREDRRCG